MADPGEIVPYADPSYYGLSTDYVLSMMTDQNPASANLANLAGPSSSSVPTLEAEGELGDSDILFDQSGWEWLNYQPISGGSSAAGPSNVDGEGCGGGGGETSNPPPENFEPEIGSSFVDMRQLLVWPIAPVPFFCSCCHVLREMVHTNGVRFRKLEIHGNVGLISHAIFEDRPTLAPNSSNSQYQMFDFCNNNMDEIKLFLLQYNVNNVLADYCPVPEPMSFFYDTLCVGMGWDDNANPKGSNQQQLPPSNQPPPPHPPQPPPPRLPPLPPPLGNSGPPGGGLGDQQGGHNRTRNSTRTSLAAQLAQRQRTVKMTVSDLHEHLHFPVREDSRKTIMCPTVVKRICPKSGLRRWPYRKIKNYERKFSTLKPNLNSNEQEMKAKAIAKIERLHGGIIQVCAGVD